MSDEKHHFESKADAGASKTYPQQAGTIRKNGYIVIRNRPCQVVNVMAIEEGCHGRAKCYFRAKDIFTGDELEDIVHSSQNCDVPHVNHTDYQLIDITEDGFVSLLTENGDDLRVPADDALLTVCLRLAKVSLLTENGDDLRLPTDDALLTVIKDKVAKGKNLVVSVTSAMGEGKIDEIFTLGCWCWIGSVA